MVSTGNQYTWKYASHILGLPNGSSETLNESETIPFAQMLLHGYVNYSAYPLNVEGDYETALLLSLETGSGVYYRWMGADDSIFDYTEFFNNFSLNYMDTFDRAVSLYKKAAFVLNDVVDKPITHHDQIAAYYVLDHKGLIGYLQPGETGYVEGKNTPALPRTACGGVFATTYGDQKVVIVNYNSADVELNDRTVVKAKSYLDLTVKEYQAIVNGSAYVALSTAPAGSADVTQEG
jgi:hypothetical protein